MLEFQDTAEKNHATVAYLLFLVYICHNPLACR